MGSRTHILHKRTRVRDGNKLYFLLWVCCIISIPIVMVVRRDTSGGSNHVWSARGFCWKESKNLWRLVACCFMPEIPSAHALTLIHFVPNALVLLWCLIQICSDSHNDTHMHTSINLHSKWQSYLHLHRPAFTLRFTYSHSQMSTLFRVRVRVMVNSITRICMKYPLSSIVKG